MKINKIFQLIIAIVITNLAGIIGSLFTTPSIKGWYAGIVKPSLNPPNWIFGPVWTTLFILMGISLFLIWSAYLKAVDGQEKKKIKIALIIFFIQLILNTLWSIIFFGSTSLTIGGLNNIGIALVEIVILWLAILATIISFYRISKISAWLLVPYILWVTFASYLNYSIWILN